MATGSGMDRRHLLRLAGGGAAVAFAGRGMSAFAQDETPPEGEEGVAESEPIEGKTNVTWWSYNGPPWVAANKELIARFEEARPDVHIVYQHFPYEVFINKLQTAYRSGTVSDIQQMFGTWVTEYAANGLLDPVPEALATDAAETYWAPALGAYEYDGVLYGLPNENNLENGGMLVNPEILAAAGVEVPTTWDGLVDAATRLTVLDDQGRISQAGLAFTNNDSITFLFLSMILQQGASYWADDGVHVNLQTDAAKKAWQDMTDLVVKHHIDDEQSYEGDSYELFFRGKAAMAMRGPWAIASGLESFPGFAFEYLPMPPYAGDEPLYAAESGWGEVVNARASDEVKAAAWDFIAFTHQPENARIWNITTTTVPALRELQDDPEIQQLPGMETSLAVLPYGQWVGPVQDRDRVWQFIHDGFTNVSLGRMTPDEALADVEQQINFLIDERLGP